MKLINNTLLICIMALFVMSCGGNSQSKQQHAGTDASTVNVYYFHGKQRCKTCIAVGNVAKKTIEKVYAGNANVKFTEVDTSDKANDALVETYQVTWNALIIAKGDNSVDITEQAFATAINNPLELESLIEKEVGTRIDQ